MPGHGLSQPASTEGVGDESGDLGPFTEVIALSPLRVPGQRLPVYDAASRRVVLPVPDPDLDGISASAETAFDAPDGHTELTEALITRLGQPLIARRGRWALPSYLVVLTLGRHDARGAHAHHGILPTLAHALAEEVTEGLGDLEDAWVDEHRGRVVAVLTADRPSELTKRLDALCARTSQVPLRLPDGSCRQVEVGVGWVRLARRIEAPELNAALRQTSAAAAGALRNRDHIAVEVREEKRVRRFVPPALRLGIQVLATLALSVALPFFAMVIAYESGHDLATPAYLMVVAALGITATLIWVESLHALGPPALPEVPATSAPPAATAIVAAYLPNEADTIVETMEHLLGQDYAGLQVILAYNTPYALPVEDELADLERRHPCLELLHVADSTSKAQNVNAALSLVRGEFVGIFDADHHPMAGAFSRAWRWIASGADVVQGHCVVRNGDESLIARTVAVEFEQIYAVSHPGRASLHGFGLFGGSNGYWRTSVLRQMRMRTDRLTEDIDVSIRSVMEGHTIVNDPGLISRELAPTTVGALWRQRVRWAQGWFQVSLRSAPAVLTRPGLTARQRAGLLTLLVWREIYPWISPMIFAVLGFIAWRDNGLSWSSPMFLITTLYTLTSGPGQIAFAWRLAAPEIRRRKGWFLLYAVLTGPIYNESKNMIARVAQIKQLCGEHAWVVTPRGRAPVAEQAQPTPFLVRIPAQVRDAR